MSVEQVAYRNLTELDRLVVIDVETTRADDGDGLRIVEIAAVEIVDGKRSKPVSWLINPGQPIDEHSRNIHGITDRMVARKPTFEDIADDINNLLEQPNTVFVAHNAGFDIAALRGEYDRIGKAWPTLPVLDTMTLHRAVGYRSDRKRFSLDNLAAELNIRRTNVHRAAGDARATARCLTSLLHKGAAQGISEMPTLLAAHGGHTTATLTNAPATNGRRNPTAAPTPEHLATHAHTLGKRPSKSDLDQWVADARECVEQICPLAILRAEAASAYSALLLPKLTPVVYEPLLAGQAGTLAGMLAALATEGLDVSTAPKWWRAHKSAILSLPPCGDGGRCSLCSDGEPCPLDILYQALTRATFSDPDGQLTDREIKILIGSTDTRNPKLASWSSDGLGDMAGFAAWMAYDTRTSRGSFSLASSVLAAATGLGLEQREPRLALAVAKARVSQGKLADAELLAEQVLSMRTTDDGFDDLAAWLHGPFLAEARRRHARPPARVRTLPRSSRPLDRHRVPRFKP